MNLELLPEEKSAKIKRVLEHLSNIHSLSVVVSMSVSIPPIEDLENLIDNTQIIYLSPSPHFNIDNIRHECGTYRMSSLEDIIQFIQNEYANKNAFILYQLRIPIDPNGNKMGYEIRGKILPFFGAYQNIIRDEKIDEILS